MFTKTSNTLSDLPPPLSPDVASCEETSWDDSKAGESPHSYSETSQDTEGTLPICMVEQEFSEKVRKSATPQNCQWT
ncbi:hypothetical protein VTN77DRAFT_9704 [Rasamsonia byssochlamydoides]|uniref:uncharacterized protein n=1 Tax=Rasamsonia byssochlamydoides TaxID=89139 RepID=UPI003743B426